mgnify:FL=1
MRILVLGGTSGIGAATVERALADGHEVRAFARGADKLEPRPGLERMAGDATSEADLRGALQGMDAVVYAIGLGRATARFYAPVTLFSETTEALLHAMAEVGPRRLVVVTGFGAGDSRQAMSTIEQMGHRAILGRASADKDRQEEIVRGSGLHWTLVRPVILTHGAASGSYKVLADPATWRNGLIPRADVADYLVRACAEGLHPHEAVVLAR